MLTDEQIVEIAFRASASRLGNSKLGPEDYIAIFRFLCEVRRVEAEMRFESVPPPGGVGILFPHR